jgi:hypothetical protein
MGVGEPSKLAMESATKPFAHNRPGAGSCAVVVILVCANTDAQNNMAANTRNERTDVFML